MAKISRVGLKLMFFTLLSLSYFQLRSQPVQETDGIVFKIYNQDFNVIPSQIKSLSKTSPQIAQYLTIDYLWWKMISYPNEKTESEFLTGLDSLTETGSGNQDFNKLAGFIYQIRYENFRNKSFSKYLTILKFHFFMENINFSCLKNADSFVQSMFILLYEMNEFIKYKFLSDSMFNTKINVEKCRLSLQKIENMSNPEIKSFDVVKTYFLAKIYNDIENDNQKARIKFTKLSNLFPENTIFKQALSEYKKPK